MRVRLPAEGYSQNPFVFCASRSVPFVRRFHGDEGYLAEIRTYPAEIWYGHSEIYCGGRDLADFVVKAFMAL